MTGRTSSVSGTSMKRDSGRDGQEGVRGWLPELLLAVSVLAMSPIAVNFVTTSVEHGSGEIEASVVILLILVPSYLSLAYTLHKVEPAEMCPSVLKRMGCHRLLRIHTLALAIILALQAIWAVLAFEEVGGLEVPSLLVRFFLLLIPFNALAVAVWTAVATKAIEGRWHKAAMLGLSSLLFAFSLFAVFAVSSTIAT